MAQRQITGHHNPQSLWRLFEAEVGSLKRYIKRMPSVSNLEYENFQTAVCTWGTILNNWPLYPLTNNSHDLQVLTPANFIVQRSLLSPPVGGGLNENLPATKKWLQVQKLQRHFWIKFKADYQGYLLKQYKWKAPEGK